MELKDLEVRLGVLEQLVNKTLDIAISALAEARVTQRTLQPPSFVPSPQIDPETAELMRGMEAVLTPSPITPGSPSDRVKNILSPFNVGTSLRRPEEEEVQVGRAKSEFAVGEDASDQFDTDEDI